MAGLEYTTHARRDSQLVSRGSWRRQPSSSVGLWQCHFPYGRTTGWRKARRMLPNAVLRVCWYEIWKRIPLTSQKKRNDICPPRKSGLSFEYHNQTCGYLALDTRPTKSSLTHQRGMTRWADPHTNTKVLRGTSASPKFRGVSKLENTKCMHSNIPSSEDRAGFHYVLAWRRQPRTVSRIANNERLGLQSDSQRQILLNVMQWTTDRKISC